MSQERRQPPSADEGSKVFYGWVIVGVGIVVTCVGFGAMLSLSVFLQPMAEVMGWSRTGIATAALLNFLWPIWDKEKRAGHDAFAKTRVVVAS